MSAQRIITSFLIALATPLAAQTAPPPLPPPSGGIPHDISRVDEAPADGIISIALPENQKRRLKKYEVPDLAGAKQALGSQLVNGELPEPLIDYLVRVGAVVQRLSLFKGGLTVIRMTGAGTLRKRVIIPPDALAAYRKAASPAALSGIRPEDVSPPDPNRRAILRIYRDDGTHIQLAFDPGATLPKALTDQTSPLSDLLRALSEDRAVTSSVAGYQPEVGDELVADDQRTWRVEHVAGETGLVQLRCTTQPTVIYVDRKYLYNYFIGKKAGR